MCMISAPNWQMMTISHYVSKSQQAFIKIMGLDLLSELLENVILLILIVF